MLMPNIINLLIQERDKINGAIAALSTGATSSPTTTGKRTRIVTDEQRAAQSLRMKAYWARKDKETAAAAPAPVKRKYTKRKA